MLNFGPESRNHKDETTFSIDCGYHVTPAILFSINSTDLNPQSADMRQQFRGSPPPHWSWKTYYVMPRAVVKPQDAGSVFWQHKPFMTPSFPPWSPDCLFLVRILCHSPNGICYVVHLCFWNPIDMVDSTGGGGNSVQIKFSWVNFFFCLFHVCLIIILLGKQVLDHQNFQNTQDLFLFNIYLVRWRLPWLNKSAVINLETSFLEQTEQLQHRKLHTKLQLQLLTIVVVNIITIISCHYNKTLMNNKSMIHTMCFIYTCLESLVNN